MKKIFLLTAVIFFGCDQKREIPEGILNQEQMVALEIEFQLLEGKLKILNVSDDSADVLYQHYRLQILDSSKVDVETYERSYKYYMEDIELMNEVYEVVIDSLSLKERLTQEQ